MHWSQGESRCYRTESRTGIADIEEYKALLDIALDFATLSKVEADQGYTLSKTDDPGKFKDKRTWPEWEVNFKNYLSTFPGVNGVPMSYIVRYQASP